VTQIGGPNGVETTNMGMDDFLTMLPFGQVRQGDYVVIVFAKYNLDFSVLLGQERRIMPFLKTVSELQKPEYNGKSPWVEVNGQKVRDPNHLLNPGDLIEIFADGVGAKSLKLSPPNRIL